MGALSQHYGRSRAHDDFFTAEEEERVTGKNLKQAESLACTKNRTRELNTLDITPLYS